MSDEGVRDDVEAQLAGNGALHLPASLSALYEERHGAERRRRLSVTMFATAAALSAAPVFEWLNLRGWFWAALGLRAVQVLLALLAAWLLPRLRGPAWREGVAYGIPVLALVALNAVIGERAPETFADRYFLATVGALAALCAVPPVPPRLAGTIAVLGVGALTLVLAFSSGTLRLGENLDIPVFAAGALGVAMLVGIRHEAARRRAFLHALRAELTSQELVRMNAELVRLTNTDALTGIDNRRKFESDLSGAWPRRTREGLGVLMIDVDHFKQFNDSAGHAAGDECLRRVAQAIAENVRSGELHVARYGGEEFAVLAVGIARPSLLALGERVRRAVEEVGCPHPGRPGHTVTISVGAAWCEAGSSFAGQEDLLRAADDALYAAKLEGRNRVVADGNGSSVSALAH